MKKSIIYLGIALVTFTNVALALDFQQSFNDNQTTQSNKSLAPSTNRNVASGQESTEEGGDLESVSPEIIGFKPYEKSAEEIIAENNQIIESTVSAEDYTEAISFQDNQLNDYIISIEPAPVCSEKSMEDRILQDSLIIESAVEVKICNAGKSKKA